MKKSAKKVPKVGRPALPKGVRRDRWLNDVRFSDVELQEMKRLAAASGMRWSDWVRQRLRQDSRPRGE